MSLHSTIPRSGLLLSTLLVAPGCFSFSFGDEGDETGDTGGWGDDEPAGPPTPSRSAQPLVEGALWSVRWDTAEAIHHAALAEPGLALANGAHAALLDPETGEPLWGLPVVEDANSVLRLRSDELIHGRRVTLDDAGAWELRHYSTVGELTSTTTFDDHAVLVVDGGARVYVLDDELVALADDGQPLWSQPLAADFDYGGLFAAEDGVVLVESSILDDVETEHRVRRFAADGQEQSASGYVNDFAFIGDVAFFEGRAYVAELGAFGLPGRIRAVEPEFGGLAWTLELEVDAGVVVETDPEGGLIALVAEPDAAAQVWWIAEDGSVLDTREATTGPVTAPLLVVGAGGELFAGGFVDGEMQLSRFE